jgi:hypothetical protein
MKAEFSMRGRPVEDYGTKIKKLVGIKVSTYVCCGILILGIAGCCCCRPQSVLESDYGNAWVYNQDVQIADPRAALDPTPAVGLSPVASTTLMGAYNKSFSGSKSGGGQSTTINLGGLTTAGSGGGN